MNEENIIKLLEMIYSQQYGCEVVITKGEKNGNVWGVGGH